MKKSTIIILVVLSLLALWGVKAYNGLVKNQESVSSAWSQVENNYQRRSDLIPNLVATVKGYAEHESSTLEAVVQARANAISVNGGNLSEEEVAAYQKAQGEVSSALGRLLMVVENYPELKANENFLDLQAQLEGTENRIAVARRDYNEAIITQGGVSVREIDPKTMASEKAEGLYFAGEVLDVDAFTGGYNLQTAWSTGYAAGLAAAREE